MVQKAILHIEKMKGSFRCVMRVQKGVKTSREKRYWNELGQCHCSIDGGFIKILGISK